MLQGSEIREKFLQFFESKGHTRVPSASLIPFNDPTLFFTNAGMVPFKDVFTGREKKGFKIAASSQKCMRVSGKHNDLENVGRTPRHHTFFEMLGNFSFGDYFKKEAIAYAWEFLTKTMFLSPQGLMVTVFQNDDEAYDIWKNNIGVPEGRIIRCGEEDNFWSMGETGPCGPCSEIHVDLDYLLNGQTARGNPVLNAESFMEVWNLVFMQYNRDEKGKLEPLPKPSIDTGMGLERLTAVLQKKMSNYDTDLFTPLIGAIADGVGKLYGANPDHDVSIRVLADHIRAVVFLISDGVQPANEGRGYVLRRILRRAIRHATLLGKKEPFFFELVPPLVEQMDGVYPDLVKNQSYVVKVIKTEEERFLETLDRGLSIIEDEVKKLKDKGKGIIGGELAFTLYDTFGFPVDLTELIAEEKGLKVDKEKFDEEMEKQKERARGAWKGTGEKKVADFYYQLADQGLQTEFVGYKTLETESVVTALFVKGGRRDKATAGEEVELFVRKTPFYGESGGQVGDCGFISSKGSEVRVNDTQKKLEKPLLMAHCGKVTTGSLRVGDVVILHVDEKFRHPTMLNHTATHILHAALREILGDHVKQAGSLVEPSRLRFDFSHFEPLTLEQIESIESKVNEVIQANYPVTKEEMSLVDAQKKGALAFFGDKYGDHVRVVSVGPPHGAPYSMEFCGGTHLAFSGEIGCFKITGQSSVASGIRRIEAITGLTAIREFQKLEKMVHECSASLKTTPAELPIRISRLSEELKKLQKEVTQLKATRAVGGAGGGFDPLNQIKEIKGVKVLAFETSLTDPKAIREFGDQLKGKMGSGILVIGSKGAGKVLLTVMVTKDLTAHYHAGKIVGELALIVGGRGGGRPDMAQAGGNLPDKLPEALTAVEHCITGIDPA